MSTYLVDTLSWDRNGGDARWGDEECTLHRCRLTGAGRLFAEDDGEFPPFIGLSIERARPLHLCGLLVRSGCRSLPVTAAEGAKITMTALCQLAEEGGGHCGMCWASSAEPQVEGLSLTGQNPPLSFWLRTGVPGEKAGQFENGISAARIRQGQGLRSRLLPGTLLRHCEKLGGFSGEGGGRGAVGPAAGAGRQRSLRDRDRRGEGADLQVGGFLCGTLVLSDLLHGHVCAKRVGLTMSYDL